MLKFLLPFCSEYKVDFESNKSNQMKLGTENENFSFVFSFFQFFSYERSLQNRREKKTYFYFIKVFLSQKIFFSVLCVRIYVSGNYFSLFFCSGFSFFWLFFASCLLHQKQISYEKETLPFCNKYFSQGRKNCGWNNCAWILGWVLFFGEFSIHYIRESIQILFLSSHLFSEAKVVVYIPFLSPLVFLLHNKNHPNISENII